ncbi:hypothetical protein H072_8473 [Dactylellina haptotyla CBS 200.50]|uniref:Uncharacterized protein n=1 Tax=Dactylellina haptotyla (strain CBS 200.50) TaxID=1284197 RepID=S8BEW6_DACHA|nr:hypothetical protein H072_8473 [Dactylellina haptotyla CBS 200.50]
MNAPDMNRWQRVYHETMAASDARQNGVTENSEVRLLARRTENLQLGRSTKVESQVKNGITIIETVEKESTRLGITRNEALLQNRQNEELHASRGKRAPTAESSVPISPSESSGLVPRPTQKQESSVKGGITTPSSASSISSPESATTVSAIDPFELEKLQFTTKRAREYQSRKEWSKAELSIQLIIGILESVPGYSLCTPDGANLISWYAALVNAQSDQGKLQEALLTCQKIKDVPALNAMLKPDGSMELWQSYLYRKLGDLPRAREYAEQGIRIRRGRGGDDLDEAVDIMIDTLRELKAEAEIEFYLSLKPPVPQPGAMVDGDVRISKGVGTSAAPVEIYPAFSEKSVHLKDLDAASMEIFRDGPVLERLDVNNPAESYQKLTQEYGDPHNRIRRILETLMNGDLDSNLVIAEAIFTDLPFVMRMEFKWFHKNSPKSPVIVQAARRKHQKMFDLLIRMKAPGSPGGPPLAGAFTNALQFAIAHSIFDAVQFTLDNGFNPNGFYEWSPDAPSYRSDQPTLPLHCAAMSSASPTAVNMILAAGGDVNLQDRRGRTALMIGVMHGPLINYRTNGKRGGALGALVDAGIRVNLADFNGDTALHAAVRREHKDMVQFLLDNGSNQRAINMRGQTAKDLASSMGRFSSIFRMLK